MAKKTITMSIEDICELTNYAHWIPTMNGATDQFMDEKYPGWDWNDLVPKLLKQGILTLNPVEGGLQLMQGLYLKARTLEIKATKVSHKVTFEIVKG